MHSDIFVCLFGSSQFAAICGVYCLHPADGATTSLNTYFFSSFAPPPPLLCLPLMAQHGSSVPDFQKLLIPCQLHPHDDYRGVKSIQIHYSGKSRDTQV